ncbi:hypothetical protein LINGRAHAP2_LOCUS4736, partial [Linum grandiflorum]
RITAFRGTLGHSGRTWNTRKGADSFWSGLKHGSQFRAQLLAPESKWSKVDGVGKLVEFPTTLIKEPNPNSEGITMKRGKEE